MPENEGEGDEASLGARPEADGDQIANRRFTRLFARLGSFTVHGSRFTAGVAEESVHGSRFTLSGWGLAGSRFGVHGLGRGGG